MGTGQSAFFYPQLKNSTTLLLIALPLNIETSAIKWICGEDIEIVNFLNAIYQKSARSEMQLPLLTGSCGTGCENIMTCRLREREAIL